MHLFNLIIEFCALKDLKCVAIDVEDAIRLDFSMTRLDDRFVTSQSATLAHFFLIKALHFTLPLLLNNLDHIALVLGLEDWKLDFDGALAYRRCGRADLYRSLSFVSVRVEPLLVVLNDLRGYGRLLV